MNQAVYEAPTAYRTRNNRVTVPESITKKIKAGGAAGIICGLVTLGVALFANKGAESNGQINQMLLIDVGLIFAMTFGIYKKSRFAATVMFIYFLGSKISMAMENPKTSGMIVGVIFLIMFLQAMVGTYQYHKALNSARQGQSTQRV